MKRYILIPVLLMALYSCDSKTYEEIEADTPAITVPVTYTANAKAIIDANCISCHSDGGSASFRNLTTYAGVADAVQNAGLLDRIQRQNGEDGQMPSTGRMPQGTIDLLIQWNTDGLLEN